MTSILADDVPANNRYAAVPAAQQPQAQDADSAVLEKLAQLAPGISPGALNIYLLEFMGLLLEQQVTSEITRDAYLEQLRCALSEKKFPKVTMRQLKAEFDRAVVDRTGPGATPGAGADSPHVHEGVIRVLAVLAEAPVASDALIPHGWVLNLEGIFKPRGPHTDRVLSTPLVLTGRLLDVSDAAESLELGWFRDGRWKQKVAARACIANRNTLLELANDGLPVNSNNASDVVQYLADYEAANLGILPPTRVAHALGG